MPFLTAIGTDNVTENARTHVITHNLGGTNVIVSAVASWATTIHKTAQAQNTVTVEFSVTAPSGGTLDWGAEIGVMSNPVKTVGPKKRSYSPRPEHTITV